MRRFLFFTGACGIAAVIAVTGITLLASCNLPDVKKPEPVKTTAGSTADNADKAPLFSSGKEKEEPVEPAEAQYPDIEPEAAIVFTLPDPREALIPVPEPPLPEPPPPVAETPPPVPAEQPPPPETPPPAAAPPAAAPPVAATPPPKEAPKRETPPPPPPSVVRPSEPVVSPPPPDEPAPVTPNIPFEPVSIVPVPTEDDLVYSRTIRAYTGQYLEIPFRGGGWVYMGEFGARRGVSYDSRRMEPDGMTFVFHADTPGTYSLKFNLQDFVRNYILNDYVKVIVEEPPMVTGSSWSQQQQRPERVVASPRWPLAEDPQGRLPPDNSAAASQAAPTSQAASSQPTPAPTTPGTQSATAAPAATTQPPSASQAATAAASAPTSQPPTAAAPTAVEDFLKLAREEYNAGRISGALGYLNQFMARYPAGSDEAFWLYGQSLEANNEATRDIRLALDYYRRLTNEYPQSSRFNDARRRIAYLERFYFNIQ